MTGSDSSLGPLASRLASACGWAVATIGALVLVGWLADLTVLKQVGSDLPSMKSIAAVALIAIGIGLVLLARGEGPGTGHRVGVVLGGLAALIGIAVLCEHVFGGFGIDELVFDDAGPNPGRPAPIAAIALVVLGLALVTLDRDPPRLALALQATGAVLALVALTGFVDDVDYLRGRTGAGGVSLPGTLALALAVSGLAFARPDRGAIAFLSGDDPASRLARRLVPVAIVVPIALGGVRLAGEEADTFGAGVGLAIVTLGTMASLLAVIVLSVRGVRTQAARGDIGEGSLRAVAEASLEAIVSADRRGRITYFNPAAERMFGYEAAEVAGEELKMLMPERFRVAHQLGLERFLATGERRVIGETIELSAVRRNGEEFPISLSLVDWEVDGEVFFTGTIADITARRRTEQQTRELAAIVASSADAVIGWSLDGRVRSWNRGAERMYGYSSDEMLGHAHDVLDAAGPGERAAEADRADPRRRPGRGVRDRPDAQGPAPDRGLADSLAGARR